jgi:glyoxylase-like metal-dependent hydrolase (beta-lactamase superfamily II)
LIPSHVGQGADVLGFPGGSQGYNCVANPGVMTMKYLAVAFSTLLFAGIASADQSIPDKYPDSVLYDAPREVIPGVWSAIGATAPPTYENSGHNNNLSFIITSEGVVVVNAGACYLLAKALHEEIRAITDQPVRYVILENGQGHAALGSNYWQEQDVPVIAHVDAAREIEEGSFSLLSRMQGYNRDKAEGTEVVMPDITFEDQYVIELGGMRIEALYLGPGHSPGDIQVWLPQQRLVISGDMAFHQRLLPIFENTDTKGWLVTYERFLALEPKTVIPGHGVPTDVEVVTRYTRDYLAFLRGEVQKVLDEGGTLDDAYKIDQSAYSHLDTFDELAARNAGIVFEAMEFE